MQAKPLMLWLARTQQRLAEQLATKYECLDEASSLVNTQMTPYATAKALDIQYALSVQPKAFC